MENLKRIIHKRLLGLFLVITMVLGMTPAIVAQDSLIYDTARVIHEVNETSLLVRLVQDDPAARPVTPTDANLSYFAATSGLFQEAATLTAWDNGHFATFLYHGYFLSTSHLYLAIKP